MANEKRLIDANALIEWIDMGHLRNPLETCFSERDVVDMLESRPTVDAVYVVRCNNCKFADQYERTDGLTGYYCMCDKNSFTYGQNWDRRFNPVKEPNDFCSYGERKEGAD